MDVLNKILDYLIIAKGKFVLFLKDLLDFLNNADEEDYVMQTSDEEEETTDEEVSEFEGE